MKTAAFAFPLNFSSLILLTTIVCQPNSVNSQPSNIVPDNTLGDESSQVVENVNDQPIEAIIGGAQREQNLFHSFQEFNVSEGREAYFISPNIEIQNIFSRVTGNNISEIMGVLGTFGESEPNLFLINPNGIIFGENARLDVGGSFAATTANGIRFGEQGSFETTNPQVPQLLTINPSAYLFNQIANQDIKGIQSQGSLIVPNGKNLVFLGGDLVFLSGNLESIVSGLNASGGVIELGGLQDKGEVSINEKGNLTFPDGVVRGDISLSNTLIDVGFDAGGFISIHAQNLEMEASVIGASILQSFGDPNVVTGNIVINVTEKLNLDDNAFIANLLFEGAQGTVGNIDIFAGSLFLRNGSQISSSTLGQGDAGRININVTDSVVFDGEDSDGNSSGAESDVNSPAVGNAGGVSIITNSLKVLNGAQISASTSGSENAGSVTIIANDSVVFDGEGLDGFNSAALSQVNPGGIGNAGGVNITTGSLKVLNGAQISASTFGKGDAGNVTINASESVVFDGEGFDGIDSIAASQVESGAIGKAGGVNINTRSLEVLNGAQISASTLAQGQGNAGSVTIIATDSVVFSGEDIEANDSGAFSVVESEAEGKAGGVFIMTNSLEVLNGGEISASTLGQGQGGEVQVNANSIKLDQDATISSRSESAFNAGDITLNIANSLQATDSEISTSSTQSSGGNITITAKDIELRGDSNIRTNISSGEGGGIGDNLS